MKNHQQDQQRLKALIAEKTTLHFFSAEDKEHQNIEWSVYGVPATNEIVVSVTNSISTFFISGDSPLLFPAMADRRFGIDIADSSLAGELSHLLWRQVGSTLLKGMKTAGKLPGKGSE